MAAPDIPASAIDFHVSDIVEELLKKPRIQEAAAQASEAVAALGKHMDATMCLRSAMWLFSSRYALFTVCVACNLVFQDEILRRSCQ